MFEVVFYATAAGNEPVLEWLRGLDKEERKVIGTDLLTVQMGFPIGMPLCKALGDGLHEVRSALPTRKEARLIFFQYQTDLVVVNGFIKKTRTTPKAELDTARGRKREYEAEAKARLKERPRGRG
jgi:phage-related protein